MNVLNQIYCRSYQFVLKTALPILPYRQPKKLNNFLDFAKEVKKIECSPLLIVTDQILKETNAFKEMESILNKEEIPFVIYSEVRANPTVQQVKEAWKIADENHCKGIVAFGGGSCMDCAKATGILMKQPHCNLYHRKGILKVLLPLPPLFAIPTTAGTGSEATLAAVLVEESKNHKFTICDFPLIPKYVVLDYRTTLSLPPSFSATTGMDALTHAIEVLIGRSCTKQTKSWSLKAVQLVFQYLPIVYEDGNNKEAREQMLIAANLAGAAFSQSYVGYNHAVAHSLGGKYHVAHGLANAILLPHVLRIYKESIYKNCKEIAVYMGWINEDESEEKAWECLISKIEALNEQFQIPNYVQELKKEDIADLAAIASKEANPLYPVPKLMDKDELKTIYYAVLKEGN